MTTYGATFGGPVTCLRVEGTCATVGTRDFVIFLTAGSRQEARTSGSPDGWPPFPSGGSTNALSPPHVLRDMAP